MVLIITLAAFILLFFFFRKNIGAALLGAIAGVAVYQLFGLDLAAQINSWFPVLDIWWVERFVYLVLVVAFPLLLYFRTGRGGLFGPLRLIEAIAFALILTSLICVPLSEIFGFDTLAMDIASWIADKEGIIIAVGVAGAYLDILFSRST